MIDLISMLHLHTLNLNTTHKSTVVVSFWNKSWSEPNEVDVTKFQIHDLDNSISLLPITSLLSLNIFWISLVISSAKSIASLHCSLPLNKQIVLFVPSQWGWKFYENIFHLKRYVFLCCCLSIWSWKKLLTFPKEQRDIYRTHE